MFLFEKKNIRPSVLHFPSLYLHAKIAAAANADKKNPEAVTEEAGLLWMAAGSSPKKCNKHFMLKMLDFFIICTAQWLCKRHSKWSQIREIKEMPTTTNQGQSVPFGPPIKEHWQNI